MELTWLKEHQDVWRWLSLYLEYWLVQCVLGVSYSLLLPDKIDTLLNSKKKFSSFFNYIFMWLFHGWLIDKCSTPSLTVCQQYHDTTLSQTNIPPRYIRFCLLHGRFILMFRVSSAITGVLDFRILGIYCSWRYKCCK